MNHIQPLPWLVNSILLCYEGKTNTGNDSEIKQHFLQHKKQSNNKKGYTDGSKRMERKVGFAAAFTDISRRGALPEEAFIHIAKMTAMRDTKKRV